MTVVQPNSIAGINSISVQSGQSLSIHKSDGTLIREIVASTGISTFSSISVGSAATANNAGKSINIGLGASISQHSDNTLSFGTNGIVRARIDSSGNFGIGTNNPSKPLTIEGTAHTDGILIHAGGNHSTAIDMDSNRSSAAGGLAELNFKWNGTTVGRIGAYAGADTTNKDDGHIHFGTSSAGSIVERLRITSTGIVQLPAGANQRIGIADRHNSTGVGHSLTISPGGGYGSGKTSGDLLLSRGRGLGSAAGGAIKFGYNVGDNTAGLDKVQMILDVNGKVGIGTEAPGQTLHLSAASGDVYNRVDTNVNGGMLLYVQGTQRSVFANDSAFSGNLINTAIGAKNDLLIRSGSSYTERLRISSSGLVGINTNAPTALLSFGVQRSVQTYPPICFQAAHASGIADAAISTTDDSGGVDIMMGSNVYMGQNGTFTRYFSSYGSAAVRCGYTGNTMFYNKSGNNAPEESMRINGDKRLLIGATAARDVGGLSAQNLAIEGTDGPSSALALIDNQNSAGGSPSLSFAKSRGTSVGSNTIVQDGDTLGAIVWAAADGNDIANQSAKISCTVDAAPGTNDTAGRLIFATSADGSSSPTSRMEINKDGLLYLNTNSYISANGDTRWRVQTGRNAISHNGTKTYTITGMAYGFARLTFGYYGEGCWINYCIQAGGYNSSDAGTQLYSYTEIVDQNGHYHSGSTADVTVTQNNASLVVVANHSAPTGNTGGQNGAYMFETCSWSGHPTLTVS